MAVEYDFEPVKDFDQWYTRRGFNDRTGCLDSFTLAPCADKMLRTYTRFKTEMDQRCANYEKLELLADGQVISPKPDLPNVSSGETAGLIRRMARNLVQHTPNLEVISIFDENSPHEIVARHVLLSNIVGSDQYSNDMQQNLFASTKTALTIGFDCVIPCLVQNSAGVWNIEYDAIHYRDVFPEPGAKDVRKATEVFVRRYMTGGELKQIARDQVDGWDQEAVRTLLQRHPTVPPRERQSNNLQDQKKKILAEGYEVVTWYSSSGAPFLTFSPSTQLLLRVEENKHPLKQHPVHFLVLEKDAQQPLGKSQVELVLGRQEFQDLMHNGAMKMWYRNINPPLLGYGAINAIPNLSPGKYTSISNPNAKIEPFEVSTQTLLQYPSIAQANLGSMVNLVGSADQQMATQAGNGMSATPQGVEAQQAMVDITTNNYQKAIESFFSHYCSYGLTIYFQELKGVKFFTPTAETRIKLLDSGLPPERIDADGRVNIPFTELAQTYHVRCVPGSLVEMEDEKQLRLLNSLFVPLSQAMPALAAAGDQAALAHATKAMQFIIEQQILLSGSSKAKDLADILKHGEKSEGAQNIQRNADVEEHINSFAETTVSAQEQMAATIAQMQGHIGLLAQGQSAILQKLGVGTQTSTADSAETQNPAVSAGQQPDMVTSARA